MLKLLDFNEVRDSGGNISLTQKTEKASKHDIAIIGMNCIFPSARNVREFWENLHEGRDCIKEFPDARMQDALHLLPNSFMPNNPPELCQAGYLDEIDKFDYEFFNLSPNEARLMDPNQRMFLQTAWSTIEDAGYGGSRIKGSKTGVYVGYSSDFKFEYHMYVNMADPDLYKDISLPGNVKSIIASRISYLLDLKGPSIVVDTACSSALVSVHMACRGIQNGDCDMALAGGVKINLLPIQKGMDDEIGIRSPGDRARTFDDSSDGTGSGEGVAAILLKPLNRALSDGDHIYAVIKGSAVNQDGNSIGLTAPNSAAQEEVILEAWKDADINPETISYIETHGTATKLGDPIEISGIERAFRKHTDKRNFCAVGSVKTNIGHLDNLAGMAGLVKLVLAMKNREIPASLHFTRPNRKIDFVNSPVYVNDRLAKWETKGFPLRGGISSFGLAGTNCHIVIEEYMQKGGTPVNEDSKHQELFTLSARNKDALNELVNEYKHFIAENTAVSLKDICYTANSGRMQHSCRLAVMAETKSELARKLEAFQLLKDRESGIYYGEFRIASGNREVKLSSIISEDDRRNFSGQAKELLKKLPNSWIDYGACLEEICRLYVKGADIEWELLYRTKRRKASLPVYPFKNSRCWVEPRKERSSEEPARSKEIDHLLLDRCAVKAPGQEIYTANFNLKDHWILSEHKVAGKCVMPGTAYLEMIRRIYSRHLAKSCLEMEDVIFLSPFVVDEGENKEIQIIVTEREHFCEFTVASQSQAGHGWNIHAEGRVRAVGKKDLPVYDINRLIINSGMKEIIEDEGQEAIVEIGPHWTDISKKMYAGSNGEYAAYFELPDVFEEDLEKLYLHPSLMDRSINAANMLIGDKSYLPLSYKRITVYGATPRKFYSYLKRKDADKNGSETVRFDVLLIDEKGSIFVEIKDYMIKKVRAEEFRFRQLKENRNIFHEIGWKTDTLKTGGKKAADGEMLVFKGSDKTSNEVVELLKKAGCSLIEVEMGNEFYEFGENHYSVSEEESSYHRLLEKLKKRKLTQIVHMAALETEQCTDSVEQLEKHMKTGLYSLFCLTRALVSNKFSNEIDIALISAYAWGVTGEEELINPHNASMFGLGKVVCQEYPNLKCRCIDIDRVLTPDHIIDELLYGGNSYHVAYRGMNRYIDEFRKSNIFRYHSTKQMVREHGVYIITGGTGGIGLEVGKYLASRNKVRIAFISRTAMPERNEWEHALETCMDKKLCRAIKAIREIEESGSEILCFSADVSNYTAMKSILEELRRRYGSVNGIIHCAGVAGDGFIIRKDEASFKAVIAPKVQGTWILDRLTEKDDLDFFLMFSSITAILGGSGQGDYTAANSYMDAFAASRSRAGKRTVSINWPAWKETGMAADYGVDEANSTLKPITTETAIFCLNELLGRQPQRIIIGELNYDVLAGMGKWFPVNFADEMQLRINEYDSTIKTDSEADSGKTSQNVMVTGGTEEAVFSETEMKVAAIWGEVLGLDEVNIYDSFSELGGDSILATRLLKRLECEYPGMIDIADVFAYNTVNGMAEYLEGLTDKTGIDENPAAEGEDDLDKLLDRLANGEISVSDAEKYY